MKLRRQMEAPALARLRGRREKDHCGGAGRWRPQSSHEGRFSSEGSFIAVHGPDIVGGPKRLAQAKFRLSIPGKRGSD